MAVRRDLGDGAWVDCVDGLLSDHQAVFDTVISQVRWRQMESLRYDHYVPERRLVGSLPRGMPMPEPLHHAALWLRSRYRMPLSGPAMLRYRDGTDFQGLHSDREMRWLDDTLVAILVLGTRRPFVLRPRTDWRNPDRIPSGQADEDIVLTPGEGDVIVMGGRCQHSWLHGVPEADTDQTRISIMWRWTSKRGAPDTQPGYSDGFQFTGERTRPGLRPTRPTNR